MSFSLKMSEFQRTIKQYSGHAAFMSLNQRWIEWKVWTQVMGKYKNEQRTNFELK